MFMNKWTLLLLIALINNYKYIYNDDAKPMKSAKLLHLKNFNHEKFGVFAGLNLIFICLRIYLFIREYFCTSDTLVCYDAC